MAKPRALKRASPANGKARIRIKEHVTMRAGDLLPNPLNWRLHPPPQLEALRAAFAEVGIVSEVLAVRTRRGVMLLDGHARADLDPDQDMPVAILDLSPSEQRRVLGTYDVIGAMAERDEAKFREIVAGAAAEATTEDFRRVLVSFQATEPDRSKNRVDKVPPLPAEPTSRLGDLWVLGKHRILCGDATKSADVSRLTDDAHIDAMVTDPPYCSGGFQEAGRRSGSVGTRGDEMIHNDTLSTRGYIALMKSAIGNANVGIIYVFTDWRMWINLFDVSESSGFGVRNMIVWDKETPGMGVGWRMQHELILCGIRVKSPFDFHKAQGNVIQCHRTGNKLHATEKPTELIERLLDVTDTAKSIYDPFGGSGTTLIASETMGRQCYMMEIDPRYVDVTVRRWEGFTGKRATLEAK